MGERVKKIFLNRFISHFHGIHVLPDVCIVILLITVD